MSGDTRKNQECDLDWTSPAMPPRAQLDRAPKPSGGQYPFHSQWRPANTVALSDHCDDGSVIRCSNLLTPLARLTRTVRTGQCAFLR